MSINVVVGAQWGDEGKGKIVDILSADADIVARFQGGANAGHTVIIEQNKYVLHLIPSGILHQDVICFIGNGVVLDPVAFFEELEFLDSKNINYSNRIFISPNTQILMPYHKVLDKLSEEKDRKIGTTGRGIGPCYVDKYSRIGIQAIDLLHPEILEEKIRNNVKIKNVMIKNYFSSELLNADEIINETKKYSLKLNEFILKNNQFIFNAIKEKKNILLEGAQGVLLDVDHGTYPFVTSSSPTSGGATIGTSISPRYIDHVLGVFKAYTTRVGEGPFPTEFNDEIGEIIRKIGSEFGATTGRPRRCGWLDLVALKYSCQINGFDSLTITKIDVLSSFEEIKVCTEYRLGKETLNYFPNDYYTLNKIEPVYKSLKGWKSEINQCKNYDDLPLLLKDYIKFIEDFVETKIKIVSIGGDRKETIIR